MRLDSLIAGQPFKTAVRVLTVFLVIYAIAGVILIRAVENALHAEQAAQTESESLFLQEIYRTAGRAGLIGAMRDLEQNMRPSERTAGLFDENDSALTGPISVLPEFTGVQERELRVLTGGVVEGRYILNIRKVDELTLITGRSTRIVYTAGRRLWAGLILLGLVLSVAIMALGLWASRTSLCRLEDMEAALRRVSDGDTDARLLVYDRHDQFDRISLRMNQNLDRLSRLMAGMKSTASAIAHDLKTPLSHVQIALHDAADAVETGGDAGPAVEAALAEVQSLNAIFETVLRISRIEASTGQRHFEPVDLKQTAEAVVQFLRPAAEENDQELCLEPDEASVPADKTMVQQLLVNLITNAIVHAGRNARITVAISARPDAVVLTVRDNGPGIPDDELAKVLDPFVRLDQARTTQGSGLGLALVRAVAEHHHAALILRDAHPGLAVEVKFPKFKNS